jgi:ribonuclease-3
MSANKDLETILQYEFRDSSLLDEALVAAGAGTSKSPDNARQHGNKALALIGDALLRLVIVDDGILAGASTGKLKCTLQIVS